MSADSVGGVMQEGKARAIRGLVIFAGVLVYCGMLLYSGVHNYSLMTRGIDTSLIVWAVLGVLALEISAAALPLALHFWTHAPMQRFAAFAFYGLDLLLIFSNVVLDYAITAGESMPAWLELYRFYLVPATPVIAGLGWSVLFLLDPAQRERGMIEALRASTREVLAARIAEQAKCADISAEVELAAAELARNVITETLGAGRARRHVEIPAPTGQPTTHHQAELQSPNGHRPGVLAGQE